MLPKQVHLLHESSVTPSSSSLFSSSCPSLLPCWLPLLPAQSAPAPGPPACGSTRHTGGPRWTPPRRSWSSRYPRSHSDCKWQTRGTENGSFQLQHLWNDLLIYGRVKCDWLNHNNVSEKQKQSAPEFPTDCKFHPKLILELVGTASFSASVYRSPSIQALTLVNGLLVETADSGHTFFTPTQKTKHGLVVEDQGDFYSWPGFPLWGQRGHDAFPGQPQQLGLAVGIDADFSSVILHLWCEE